MSSRQSRLRKLKGPAPRSDREEFCQEMQWALRRLADAEPAEIYHAESDVFACVDLYREALKAAGDRVRESVER